MATIVDSFTSVDNSGGWGVYGETKYDAMIFKASKSYTINQVGLKLYRSGPLLTTYVSAEIRAVISNIQPSGTALCSGSLSASSWTTSTAGSWAIITLGGGVALTSGVSYAIVWTMEGGSSVNYIGTRIDSTGAGYADGTLAYNTAADVGDYKNSNDDALFRTYEADAIVDKYTHNRIVVAAGDYIYWEEPVGTLAEVTAARSAISTYSRFDMCYAYNKLFMVSEDTLKFINLKAYGLPTGEIGAGGVSVPPITTILSGQTTGAGMVVDFVTASTGSAVVYGYLIGSTAFSSVETVEDVGSTLSVSFTINEAIITAPSCETWNVFASAGTTTGSMPDNASIVCRYRGRLVMSGDVNYPHQWYMTRIGNPFDREYISTDPLTAIKGNNSDAGEVGDIVRALVPYGDDYLIFGCADTIHVLAGDPASGGSIDEISSETGMYGKEAWAKDNDGNLYFFGSAGIYKMSDGRGRPVNISQATLPNLVTDLGAAISTHRVVMSFDPFRQGLILSKTVLTSGANDNWFYDLNTNAFFPEDYPADCGIFSSVTYNADDASDKCLALGCQDGYVRYFDNSQAYDETSASVAAITSYVGWAEQIGEEDMDGRLTHLQVELAKGVGSSDTVVCELYRYDEAESILSAMQNGTTAFLSVALSGRGRQNTIRQKVKGAYLGLKFSNNTSGESLAINKVIGHIEPSGRTF